MHRKESHLERKDAEIPCAGPGSSVTIKLNCLSNYCHSHFCLEAEGAASAKGRNGPLSTHLRRSLLRYSAEGCQESKGRGRGREGGR